MKCAPPFDFFGWGTGPESKMLGNGVKYCVNKLATKIAEVCCDGLLLAHSANRIAVTVTVVNIAPQTGRLKAVHASQNNHQFFLLTFVFASHKIFLVRPFCAPLACGVRG